MLGFIEAKVGHPIVHAALPIALDHLRIPNGKHTTSVKDATVAHTARGDGEAHGGLAQETEDARTGRGDGVPRENRFAQGLMTFTRVPIGAMHHFVRALESAKLPLVAPKTKRSVSKR